jgi:hypothetical protein
VRMRRNSAKRGKNLHVRPQASGAKARPVRPRRFRRGTGPAMRPPASAGACGSSSARWWQPRPTGRWHSGQPSSVVWTFHREERDAHHSRHSGRDRTGGVERGGGRGSQGCGHWGSPADARQIRGRAFAVGAGCGRSDHDHGPGGCWSAPWRPAEGGAPGVARSDSAEGCRSGEMWQDGAPCRNWQGRLWYAASTADRRQGTRWNDASDLTTHGS